MPDSDPASRNKALSVHFFARSKEMNKQKIFKVFFRTLSLAAKKGYPQESRPCVSRPPAADPLDGHMLAGTA